MNRILKKTFLVAGLGAVLGFGAAANAAIVDLFSTPALSANDRVIDETLAAGGCALGSTAGAAAVGNGCFYQYADPGTNTILGGYRDLFVQITAQGAGDPRSALSAGGGFLSFSNNAGTTGVATVQWDGNDNSALLDLDGLGGANLVVQAGCPASGCNQFVASVVFADLGFGYSITVVDMAGHISTLQTLSVNAVPPIEDAVYLFEWFSRPNGSYFDLGLPFTITHSGTPGNAIDFTSVGALQFQVNAPGNPYVDQTVAVDLTLAGITKQGVPEPGTLALLGLALTGLAGLRRRRTMQ